MSGGLRPDWFDYNLECYSCGTDLWLVGLRTTHRRKSQEHHTYYCSRECGLNYTPLTEQMLESVSYLIARNLYSVDTLDVADAILSSADTGYFKALRSFQWRTRRLNQLHVDIELLSS